MTYDDYLQRAKAHGYCSIPTAQRVFLDSVAIDRDGTDVTRLLEFAVLLEAREAMPVSLEERLDRIELTDTDPNKIVCLSLFSEDIGRLEMFRSLCYTNLPKEMGWFHQCNTHNYQMFEFWNGETNAMITMAEKIAKAMALPVFIDLRKDYRPGETVALEPFQSFDSDMCERGNFFG